MADLKADEDEILAVEPVERRSKACPSFGALPPGKNDYAVSDEISFGVVSSFESPPRFELPVERFERALSSHALPRMDSGGFLRSPDSPASPNPDQGSKTKEVKKIKQLPNVWCFASNMRPVDLARVLEQCCSALQGLDWGNFSIICTVVLKYIGPDHFETGVVKGGLKLVLDPEWSNHAEGFSILLWAKPGGKQKQLLARQSTIGADAKTLLEVFIKDGHYASAHTPVKPATRHPAPLACSECLVTFHGSSIKTAAACVTSEEAPWSFVALVYEPPTFRLYLDGACVGSKRGVELTGGKGLAETTLEVGGAGGEYACEIHARTLSLRAVAGRRAALD